jgi:hypothetical protein
MPSHTAEYWYIDLALADRQRSFAALDEEMTAFKALPLASFEPKKREGLPETAQP